MAQEKASVKSKPTKNAPEDAAAPSSEETFADDHGASTSNTDPPHDQTENFDMNASPREEEGESTEYFEGGQAVGGKSALEQTAAMEDHAAAPAAPPKDAAAKSAAKGAATNMGDYRLIKKLGQGGMGAVYKAHQISLDREVAVKVLSKELAAKPAFVQRFKREARVMARMDHPNILRCFDVGEAKGYHYLSMEYIEGGSIEGWIKKLGKFPLGDALHIIMAVSAGLLHAHEQNLIHRDIKPDNILLTKKGVIKVADLGLAKATDDDMSLTKTGTGAGTPIYMAPEQARDAKHVDGRVDIYAMGVMLYVFLTGQAPFKGETLVELIEAKERGKYEPMRKFNDEVPERLELIVGKMVARKPEHRYASCGEIIKELEGLGLANDRLSFLGEGAAALNLASSVPSKGKAATQSPAGGTTKTPKSNPAVTLPSMLIEPADTGAWYWKFVNDQGKRVTKKLTHEQIMTLIKSESIEPDAQVSKDAKTGFRSLGSYNDFKSQVMGKVTKERADRKTEKFKDMYKQIEKEEASRLRRRWFHNLSLRVGGFFGLILWLCVLGAVLVGGFFLVKYLIYYLGSQVEQAGKL